MHAFLGINVYWICQNWQLNCMLIDYVKLLKSHSGKNIASAFGSCIWDFGIQTKVCKEWVSLVIFTKGQVFEKVRFRKRSVFSWVFEKGRVFETGRDFETGRVFETGQVFEKRWVFEKGWVFKKQLSYISNYWFFTLDISYNNRQCIQQQYFFSNNWDGVRSWPQLSANTTCTLHSSYY